MIGVNDTLPTDAEDGVLKPRSPASPSGQTKPAGRATVVFEAMEEAIVPNQKMSGGKREASVKETGEEVPQDQWERFEAVDKKRR